MRHHTYIGDRQALLAAGEAIRRQYDRDLKEKVQEVIRKRKNYELGLRNGAYDYLDAYPCGHQDAFADKVDALYREYEILTAAWELHTGRATRLQALLDRALEKDT